MRVDRTCPLCLVDRGSLFTVVLGDGSSLTLACGQCAVAIRPFLAMLRRAHDPDAIPGMDTFVLRIRLGNDGMCDRYDVADVLDRVTLEMRLEDHDGKLILDENGNTVGSWAFHLHAAKDEGEQDE